MNVVTTALKELYGLFVEDGAYAVAILVWIALSLALLRYIEPSVRGVVLFAGFAAIVIAGVLRGAEESTPP